MTTVPAGAASSLGSKSTLSAVSSSGPAPTGGAVTAPGTAVGSGPVDDAGASAEVGAVDGVVAPQPATSAAARRPPTRTDLMGPSASVRESLTGGDWRQADGGIIRYRMAADGVERQRHRARRPAGRVRRRLMPGMSCRSALPTADTRHHPED